MGALDVVDWAVVVLVDDDGVDDVAPDPVVVGGTTVVDDELVVDDSGVETVVVDDDGADEVVDISPLPSPESGAAVVTVKARGAVDDVGEPVGDDETVGDEARVRPGRAAPVSPPASEPSAPAPSRVGWGITVITGLVVEVVEEDPGDDPDGATADGPAGAAAASNPASVGSPTSPTPPTPPTIEPISTYMARTADAKPTTPTSSRWVCLLTDTETASSRPSPPLVTSLRPLRPVDSHPGANRRTEGD